MGGDERGAGRPSVGQRPLEPDVDPDEGVQADGDGVCGSQRIPVVVGELEPWDEHEPVHGPGAAGLPLDGRSR